MRLEYHRFTVKPDYGHCAQKGSGTEKWMVCLPSTNSQFQVYFSTTVGARRGLQSGKIKRAERATMKDGFEKTWRRVSQFEAFSQFDEVGLRSFMRDCHTPCQSLVTHFLGSSTNMNDSR